jgi:dTDP-L-rhamnose 4-epimerase
VHSTAASPAHLNRDARFVEGDVRDRERLERCLVDEKIEVVLHHAAAVGVGQSMYEIRHYVDVNCLGTANLLDILVKAKHDVRRIVVASSMSIYGEGAYRCQEHGLVYPRLRPPKQLERRDWDVYCPRCGRPAEPIPTSEEKPLAPTSVYATTKRDQEEIVLEFGEAYEIPAVALRYFNVYGPRQSLSNPYTGVVAIFASRLLNGNAPLVFEDGRQSRDFTHVDDIVRANLIAMESDEAAHNAFNVGTGRSTSILEVAHVLAKALGTEIEPVVIERYRAGDIRHCYADVDKIRSTLGFEPSIDFETGMQRLLAWLESAEAEDRADAAMAELETRGLTR